MNERILSAAVTGQYSAEEVAGIGLEGLCGITSSDVSTKALRVKQANVMGQIRLGIPVWQTGEESTFPHTPYVIFPGNVGEAETLKEAVEILQKA